MNEELKTAVRAMIDERFAGDFSKMFAKYAHDRLVGHAALVKMLKDAGINNSVTQHDVANMIIRSFDTDWDNQISEDELAKAIA